MTNWLPVPGFRMAIASAAALVAVATLEACGGTTVRSPDTTAQASASGSLASTSAPTTPPIPSASVAPSIAPNPLIAWSEYASERFAYSIEYPEGWVVTEAITDWPAVGWPSPNGPAVDRFRASTEATDYVTVSSDALESGDSAAGRRAEIDLETALACRVSGTVTIAIDGSGARRQDQFCFGKDHLIEVFVEHDARIYLVDWFAKSEIPDADRALFDAMLARFRFED